MAKNEEMSQDTKTIITALLLAFAYPVGIIMMFVWTKWPGWVKTLVVLPLVLAILAFFLVGGIVFSAIMNGGDNLKDMDTDYSISRSDDEATSSSYEYMMSE